MAVLSEKYKFIFFQNPRTGSTMLEKVLIEEFEARLFPVAKNEDEKIKFKHITYNELVKNRYIAAENIEKLFKFTSIRHPYDKAVSDWLGGKKFFKGSVGEQTRYENILANQSDSLETYLKFILLKGLSLNIRIVLAKLLPNFVFLLLANIYYIARSISPNKFISKEMDYVIKTEELQSGFEEVCARIGIHYCEKLPVINATNEIQRKHDEYHSDFSRQLIYIMYRDIFKKFSYLR